MGVNWGRAGKDARGPKVPHGPKSIPARSSLVVPATPQTPTSCPPSNETRGSRRSHGRDLARAWGHPGSAGALAGISLPSHLESLHGECASLVVRVVIQAVVEAGLRLAWE